MKRNKNLLILLDKAENIKIGTKGRNLKIITQETDYPIPKTLVLTTDFFKYLIEYNRIENPFLFEWNSFKIPVEYEEEIIEKIQEVFNDRPLVIRSSATCEDSPLLSFAGQYSSFLNIKERKNILRAIKLCYESLFSDNAEIYAKFNNINLKNEAMAILIQEVISVKISGIIFTVDPVSKEKGKIIVEYTKGFGDKIVSGHILPKYMEIPKRLSKNKLSPFFRKLLKIGLNLEKVFGYPQNIEWGFDGKKFYIFQSRPITALDKKPVEIKKDINKLTLIGKGRSACLGQCQGKLKIIKGPSSYSMINCGDIIFNKEKIDIGIIAKIPEVAGIITTGGVLSHLAVIAREFNKPTLVEPLVFNGVKYQGKKIFLDTFQEKIFSFKE